MPGKYQTFQPGEYFDWEQPHVNDRLQAAAENRAVRQKLIKGPIPPATEEDILRFNRLWNPYDRLYNDTEYARSLGFPGVPAYPGYGAPRGTGVAGFPKNIGDAFYYTNDGYSLKYERRIFAGDVFNPSEVRVDFRDVTPPGADIRIWFNGGERVYRDQNGEKLITAYGNTRDCYRKIIDGSPKMTFEENMTEWCKYFPPAHITTDADWDRIRALWAQERVNGEDTPYWEDVDIGYELPKTCSDGPVTYMHLNYWHYIGNWSIFTREELSDPAYLEEIFRDRYGQYLDETSLHYAGRNEPGERMVWYNDTGAYLAARTVTNFIGVGGYVTRFRWQFFPYYKELRTGPIAADMFNKVKGMEGRDCERHGSEGDTCIGRAVVIGKRVNEKGEHEVDFAVWGETLDGEIVQACPMSAVLPSRKG